MIAFLKGILREKREDRAVIEVSGVGFEVTIPVSTYSQLPATGESVMLYTVFVLREDECRLFGFSAPEDRELFNILVRVPGIGLKMAVDILSTFTPERFATAVGGGDHVSLCRVPGIGKKRAERLIFDLKSNEALMVLRKSIVVQPEPETTAPPAASVTEEAVEALIALGCKPTVAHQAVSEAGRILGTDTGVEGLIKEALKHR